MVAAWTALTAAKAIDRNRIFIGVVWRTFSEIVRKLYYPERVASDLGRGGLRAARMYCASNARKAVSTVEPTPAMPSSMLRPSNATHLPEWIDNSGRRTAAGLRGCAAKYSSARSFAAIAWSMSLCFIIPSFCRKVRKRRAN